MSRRYVPDPNALTLALARRLDVAEQRAAKTDRRLGEIGLDVAALGRGLADLTGQIRRLADHGGAGESAGPAGPTGSASGDLGSSAGGGEGEGPQPDWFTVGADEAGDWLTALDQWATDVLTAHGLTLTGAPCWPLHPDVIAELLALHADRAAAYDGERPTPVSEWLARWLPTARTRITDSLAACVDERGHRHNGRTYDARGLDLASVAAWWATDRDTPAPVAFALPLL